MLRYAAIASTALFLTACSNMQHKTPEARQQIKHDLKLTEITDTAQTSYCWLQIGGRASCKYTSAISVLTPDGLRLVDYEKGVYVQKDIIKADDVKCIADHDSQNFYIFKDQLAVSVIPYTEVHRSPSVNNPEYRAKAIKTLLANGQPYLTGEAATFTRETGSKDYNVHTISMPSGPIPIVVGTDALEIFSPCAGSKQ